MRWVAVLALIAVGACGDNRPRRITIVVPAKDATLVEDVEELAELSGYGNLRVEAVEDPRAAIAAGGGLRIGVVTERSCGECYSIDPAGDAALDDAWIVDASAGDRLGAQYGVAHALENLGFRFRHPDDTYAPAQPAFDPAARGSLLVIHRPETRVRGLQLHTLHPIEAYFDFWEPSPEHLARARRVLTWIVANRGNFVQWVALKDVSAPGWRAHTAAIIDAAHAHGLRTGLNLQLYGTSNLQLAYDLWDDPASGTLADALAARLPPITGPDLGFDVYDLSFGEFFGADPDRFIADVNQVAAGLRAAAPAAEMHAVVHVGADQRVTYMGQDLIYYFLVQFADPAIVPDIHTVMFYDLYEDAGGAYHHDDFHEHREYLLARLQAHQPVVYFPEAAYWVAFDDSVPVALPLYVRSRWLDLARLRADTTAMGAAPLDGHLVFSSGWEWGYWLHDYASLRAGFELPRDYTDLVRDAYGDDLAPAADVTIALADLEASELIGHRLAPYLAGRDGAIDLGRNLGIVSQPDRVTFDDLAAGDDAARAQFAHGPLAALATMADRLDSLVERATTAGLPDSRWSRELIDGVRITALRAHFVTSAYRLSLAYLAGDQVDVAGRHVEMLDDLDRARAVVAGRRGDLHDPTPARLLERAANRTFYPYGYLTNADTLCFWVRELRQVEQQAGLGQDPIPDCIL